MRRFRERVESPDVVVPNAIRTCDALSDYDVMIRGLDAEKKEMYESIKRDLRRGAQLAYKLARANLWELVFEVIQIQPGANTLAVMFQAVYFDKKARISELVSQLPEGKKVKFLSEALIEAIVYKKVSLALSIMDMGANIKYISPMSRSGEWRSSAWMVAVLGKNSKIIKALVRHGVDVNMVIKADGDTALCYAEEIEHIPMIRYLKSVDAGKEFNEESSSATILRPRSI